MDNCALFLINQLNERIMQVITFTTVLHYERVWGYIVRDNGITLTSGYAVTKELAERMANDFINNISAW